MPDEKIGQRRLTSALNTVLPKHDIRGKELLDVVSEIKIATGFEEATERTHKNPPPVRRGGSFIKLSFRRQFQIFTEAVAAAMTATFVIVCLSIFFLSTKIDSNLADTLKLLIEQSEIENHFP